MSADKKESFVRKGKDARREKFLELSGKRTNQAIKYIKLIGNLSDRSNYIYDDAEIKFMLTAVKTALKETESKFQNASDKKISEHFDWTNFGVSK